MRKVLIVDDYMINQRLYTHILRRGGYDTLYANNGVEALDVLEQEQVNLLISDLEMPEMDGLELAEQVRAHPKIKELPIIMVTGSGVPDDEAQAKALGINYFLHKPVGTRELLEAVNLLCATT